MSKSISESEKLASVSERAALLWFLAIGHHDVEGLLDGEPGTALRIYGGRPGQAWGWSVEMIRDLRGELERAGLWIDRTADVVEVAEHRTHNKLRVDREGPSSLIRRIQSSQGHGAHNDGVGPELPGSTPELPRVTPPQVQVQVQVQAEAEVARARVAEIMPANGAAAATIEDLANSLLRCWKRMHREVNDRLVERGERAMPAPPATMYAAQILARDHVETLAFFPTDDLKVAEMNRVARCYSEKELRVTFNGVVSQMGQAWDGCTQPDPVIWQKEPEPVPSGPVPPLVARIARGIGKEMP